MGVLLATNEVSGLDISTITEVLNFTYTGQDPALVLVRLVVSGVGPRTDDGYYLAHLYINGSEVVPEYPIYVDADATSFVVQTKTVVVVEGDVVSVSILGMPDDTDAGCLAHVVDVDSGVLTAELSDSDLERISAIVVSALSRLTVVPRQRVVLSPIEPCVKSFLLPK